MPFAGEDQIRRCCHTCCMEVEEFCAEIDGRLECDERDVDVDVDGDAGAGAAASAAAVASMVNRVPN